MLRNDFVGYEAVKFFGDMATSESIDQIKSYVYGVGRGCGIKVVPRHHIGILSEQILSLANDVINADIRPSNDQLGEECVMAYSRLSITVADGAENAIADALRQYVATRQRVMSRGAVE